MVRSNLRLWAGVAAFTLLVRGFALIALSRILDVTLAGRCDLILIETPEGMTAQTEDAPIQLSYVAARS